jgi:hypothetical protein
MSRRHACRVVIVAAGILLDKPGYFFHVNLSVTLTSRRAANHIAKPSQPERCQGSRRAGPGLAQCLCKPLCCAVLPCLLSSLLVPIALTFRKH